jgi:hypothetical protein
MEIGIGHDLHNTKPVTQIYKIDSTVYPPPVNPASQGYNLTSMSSSNLAARMCLVHVSPPK